MNLEKTYVDLGSLQLSNKINYHSKITTIGSCFSDEIGSKFQNYGYGVLINPFGTVFNPVSIQWLVEHALLQKEKPHFIEHDGYILAYECHSTVHGESVEGFTQKLNEICKKFIEQIDSGTHLFITLGTAWVYEMLENKQVVSNCHKQPSALFQKRLLSTKEIIDALNAVIDCLREKNTNLELIFTVSPVRHKKDGLWENNVSKGRLTDAIYQLHKADHKIYYLPVFEMINDELRDYQHFEEDLIHPNEKAVNYVWERIKPCLFDEVEIQWQNFKDEIMLGINHRPMFPKSNTYHKHLQHLLQKSELSIFCDRLQSEISTLKKKISDLNKS
ncbi:MAG: GSCFA domain-containing protein [Cytophagales bacterium]